MKTSKLFLIVASVLAASVVSCAHYSPSISDTFPGTYYYGKNHDYNLKALKTKNWTENHNSALRDLNSSLSEKDSAVFAHYCAHGKQQRSLKFHVIYLIPKVKPGTPLDEAVKLRNTYTKEGRDAVRKIFISLSLIGNTAKDFKFDYYDDISFFALPEQSKGDPFTYFIDSIGNEKNEGENRLIFLSTTKNDDLYLVPADSERILWFGDVKQRNEQDWSLWYWHWSNVNYRNNNHQYLPKDLPGNFYGITSSVEFDGGGESLLPFGIVPLNSKKILYPLTEYYNTEAAVFVNDFTMLIPKNQQERYFIHKQFNRNVLFGYDDNEKEISPAAAIRDRKALWNSYIAAFTNMKEAANPDLRSISFEVSIDLNPFCEYGIQIQDLLSK